MKRKAIILLLALSITTVFVIACGNKTTDNIEDNTENEVDKEIISLYKVLVLQ